MSGSKPYEHVPTGVEHVRLAKDLLDAFLSNTQTQNSIDGVPPYKMESRPWQEKTYQYLEQLPDSRLKIDLFEKKVFQRVRGNLGKSQEELARALGLTVTTVGRIERGAPPGDLVKVYAELMELSGPIEADTFHNLYTCSSHVQRILTLCCLGVTPLSRSSLPSLP